MRSLSHPSEEAKDSIVPSAVDDSRAKWDWDQWTGAAGQVDFGLLPKTTWSREQDTGQLCVPHYTRLELLPQVNGAL
ncbi:hypothetical protein DPEC_G00007580 [Dallia pectoralis]|uniref:Uncharacterized protein n=1 Tax=Dallia pectoralis TaxID=75939 RepID=A0ACC2HKG5_DALPE|nr:hypothetical protein DPEC_G00007580 [Dallia pectoralis]